MLPEQPAVEEATPPTEKPPAAEPPAVAEVKPTSEAAHKAPPPVKPTSETAHKAPPPVKSKPKRSPSTEHLLDVGSEGNKEEGRRLPVGTTAPMGQLADILKGGVFPLKPRVSPQSALLTLV